MRAFCLKFMEIEYFVLVQVTMTDFYKIAGMPRMIAAVDGSWIPSGDQMIRNICVCAIKAFMP